MSKVLEPKSTFKQRLSSLLKPSVRDDNEEYIEKLYTLYKDLFTCLDFDTIDSYLSTIDTPNKDRKFDIISFISYVIEEISSYAGMEVFNPCFLADLIVENEILQNPSNSYIDYNNQFSTYSNFAEYYIDLGYHYNLDNLIYFIDTISEVVPITSKMISGVCNSNNPLLVFHILENYTFEFTIEEWENILLNYICYINEWSEEDYYKGIAGEEMLELYFKYFTFILDQGVNLNNFTGDKLVKLRKKLKWICKIEVLTFILDNGFDPLVTIDNKNYIDLLIPSMKKCTIDMYGIEKVLNLFIDRGILEKEDMNKYVKLV